MRRRDLVVHVFVIECETENIAAEHKIVDELAAQNDRRQLGHEIHRAVGNFPELAVFVPTLAVNLKPGVLVDIQASARRDVRLALRQRAFNYPDTVKLVAQRIRIGVVWA